MSSFLGLSRDHVDARQDGAEDGELDHVQELSEAGVPGMNAVTFCFPGKVCVKGYQLQRP